MAVIASGTARVPVTGYQVVLTPAGHRVTLVHPQAGPLVVTEDNQLGLWCAGTEMLTTLIIRVHDHRLGRHEPTVGDVLGSSGGSIVEEVMWLVTEGGRLLAHAQDYGATPVPDVDLPAGEWRVRIAVAHRDDAARLDEQLLAEDEADFEHPRPPADVPAGPVLGPEVWLLDLSPAR